MAAHFTGQEFEGIKFTEVRELSGQEFTKCSFRSCVLAARPPAESDFVVRDVTLRQCAANACTVVGVHFDEVVVDGLRLAQLTRLVGCVFRHVTIRGQVGPIMTVPHHDRPEAPREVTQRRIVEAYRGTDWALDISEAEFSGADFYYVPGDLIRRDPATQFLVRREALGKVNRDSLPTYVEIAFSRLEESSPFDSMVAVAPKRSSHFERWMAEFEQARAQGLVE